MTRAGNTTGLWSATGDFAAALARYAGRRGVGTVALVAIGAAIEGAGIALLVPILGIVLHQGEGRAADAIAAFGPADAPARLALLLAGFIALMGVRAAVLYRRDVALARLQTGFVEDLRNRVIGALAASSWDRVVALQHARVTNLLGADIARIAGSTQLLIQAGVAAAMLAIQAGVAIALAPLLAGAVVLALAVAGGITLARARWARGHGAALTGAQLSLLQGATGFLGGLKAALAENRGARFAAEFAATQGGMRDHQVAFVRRAARGRAGFALASALAGAVVVWVGVATGLAGGVLITLIVLFARMSGPVAAIQSALQNVFFGLPSFEAVRALERDLGGLPEATPARVPPAGAVELADAGYRHDGGSGVGGISLTIAPGEIVGLAGPSGAGKTTLVDLLSGLIAPQTGAVLVGGAVLDAGLRTGWRDSVGYVAQDGFLFHGSVRRNLMPDGGADDAVISRALAATGAETIVAALPEGLDTIVGERGARLSGGERQRLAIARALLREPRLLVLDEATNAIDLAGEAALLDRLAALDPRPAILIVAHRPESLARCGRVIQVEDGTVVR